MSGNAKTQLPIDSEKGNKVTRKMKEENVLPEVIVLGKKRAKSSVVEQMIKADLPEKIDIAQLNNTNTTMADIKMATVKLVPHIKKNGKPSKRNFDIQLTDENGNTFILTKKDMAKAVKQQGNDVASRAEMIDASWNNYIEAAKRGQLQPETVASFFRNVQEKLAGVKIAPDLSMNTTINPTPVKAAEVSQEKTAGVKIAPDMSINAPKNPTIEITPVKVAEVSQEKTAGVKIAPDMSINTPKNPTIEITPVKAAEANIEPEVRASETVAVKDETTKPVLDTKPVIYEPENKTIVLEETAKVADTPKPAKIEETTINNVKQTQTKTPDGITYSFDENGKLSCSGKTGINLPLSSDYLTPGYKKETSSKQDFEMNSSNGNGSFYKAYKDKDGNYHCGGSTGTIYNAVVRAEKVALKNIVVENAVYNDLKRKETKGSLSAAEKNFMKGHEKTLADRGLIRCPDGVLEYKDCPEKYYNKSAHNKAAALNLAIQRGTTKSVTTTIRAGDGNANVNTIASGRGSME